jgi:Arc/MetJ family transcription regulator/predicted nucleic acid-binding protein
MVMSRTNIEIDDALVRKARKLTRLKTKRQIVHRALELLVRSEARKAAASPLRNWHLEGWREGVTEKPRLILVDSSVWVDFFSSSPGSAAAELRRMIAEAEPFALAGVIVAEILQGLTREVTQIERHLAQWEMLERFAWIQSFFAAIDAAYRVPLFKRIPDKDWGNQSVIDGATIRRVKNHTATICTPFENGRLLNESTPIHFASSSEVEKPI